jgi:hypothetical protein
VTGHDPERTGPENLVAVFGETGRRHPSRRPTLDGWWPEARDSDDSVTGKVAATMPSTLRCG